jgi:hypothetical protein
VKKSNHIHLVCQSVIRGDLPESAIEWPVVEVVYTTRMIGSGESTSWYSHCLLRRSGNLLWQGNPEQLPDKLSLLCGKLHLVTNGRGRKIYVETGKETTP